MISFHEMMGSEGNELVRETMDPLFEFIDRHAGRADVHLVRTDAAAHAV